MYMKIIISPAKQMKIEKDYGFSLSMPIFIKDSEVLLKYLQEMDYETMKSLWNCSDKIAKPNYEHIQNMDLYHNLSPALLSYDGIQYKYMACDIFEKQYFEYVNKHLNILSGFYGILKPMDAITTYRLEMQAKLKGDTFKNLYDFWKDKIYQELIKDNDVILNLASKEYSKCIEKYLTEDITYITCVFGEIVKDKVVEKGVYCKMARGEMVRYMAENNITNLEDIKTFNRLGYKYSDIYSSDQCYVFIKG